MDYLLDTNIVSDLIRNPQGRIASRIDDVGESHVCTSVIVAAEMRYGVSKKSTKALADRVDLVLGVLKVLPFQVPADLSYGRLRALLERAGRAMGGNDMLIAAHALSLGMTVVTDDEREFRQASGLRVENWLRDA